MFKLEVKIQTPREKDDSGGTKDWPQAQGNGSSMKSPDLFVVLSMSIACGTEPTSQQPPEPLQWQQQILDLLHHKGTPLPTLHESENCNPTICPEVNRKYLVKSRRELQHQNSNSNNNDDIFKEADVDWLFTTYQAVGKVLSVLYPLNSHNKVEVNTRPNLQMRKWRLTSSRDLHCQRARNGGSETRTRDSKAPQTMLLITLPPTRMVKRQLHRPGDRNITFWS